MIAIEKLDNNKFSIFNKLVEESKNKTKYTMDFYKFYDNQSFIYKYFLRKMVHLIKVDNKYIGFIWTESAIYDSNKISEIFILEEFLPYFNKNLLMILKRDSLVYECYENEYTLKLLKVLGMYRIRLTNLMKLIDLNLYFNDDNTSAAFSLYRSKKDAKVRCALQNAIFNDHNRVSLSVEDIYYDEKQEYYVEGLALFIKDGEIPVGYGQIIFTRGVYFVVNFGVLESYRSKGYGKALLIKLIELARKRGVKELYIRVDDNNIPAKFLYRKIGFIDVGNFSTWLWCKKII
ncbi:MAG: GNAT family N-acetyltransferase [Clostridium sp.]|nr:GNAT family N-acetyltransferase [Clostridium sp.]